MRQIMISVQPQWVEKILNHSKTIEIRKTAPKCELPCKVYIYCTKNEKQYFSNVKCCESLLMDSNSLGKVVAEFTLNEVEDYLDGENFVILGNRTSACLTFDEIMDYANGKPLYAWYIDNLKIYDKPKELSEFTRNVPDYSSGVVMYSLKPEPLKRPFQSWGYVNENN